MSAELFDVLSLPVQAVKPEVLEEAYLRARKLWFFRQYDPQFMLEAKEKLARVEEANLALKDPRRQSALIRETRAARRQRADAIESGPARQADPQPSPRAVHRPTVVRQLLAAARQFVLANKRDLNEAEIQKIARQGLDLGLDYADARELADRIAVQVADRFGK